METRHGYAIEDWRSAKEEIRQVLVGCAKAEGLISYGELCDQVQTVCIEPYSYALAAMLEEISSEEDGAARGMLTAVVVLKIDDVYTVPGSGFFKLATRLGRTFSDEDALWSKELHKVYNAWRGEL